MDQKSWTLNSAFFIGFYQFKIKRYNNDYPWNFMPIP